MYSTMDDLKLRFAPGFVTAVSDDDADGEPNSEVVTKAIADADAEIDARLSPRFNVPFNPVPALVAGISSTLAARNLARRSAASDGPSAAEISAVERLLTDLAEGRANLGQSVGAARMIVSVPMTGPEDGGDDNIEGGSGQ